MKHLLTMLSYKVYLQNFEQGTPGEKQIIEIDDPARLRKLPEDGKIPCAIVPRMRTELGVPKGKTTELAEEAIKEVGREHDADPNWLDDVLEPLTTQTQFQGDGVHQEKQFSTDHLDVVWTTRERERERGRRESSSDREPGGDDGSAGLPIRRKDRHPGDDGPPPPPTPEKDRSPHREPEDDGPAAPPPPLRFPGRDDPMPSRPPRVPIRERERERGPDPDRNYRDR